MWSDLEPYLGPGGAVSLLLVVAVMVYTDRLVPYRSHRRQLAAKQAEIDRLSTALDKAESQRDRLMFGVADVTVGVMRALPAAPEWVAPPPKDPVS